LTLGFDVIFLFVNYAFYLWMENFDEMLKHIILSLMTKLKNMLIHRAKFHCELFQWFVFLAECEILNFVDIGRHTRTASLGGWPLAHYQSNGLILSDVSIILFKSFIISIFISLSIGQKHLAQTCNSITLADLPVFSGRTLRCTNQHFLDRPCVSTDFGKRAFSYKATNIWNNLPLSVIHIALRMQPSNAISKPTYSV